MIATLLTDHKPMKAKLALLVIAGLVGLPLASFAQAPSPAGEASSTAVTAAEVATAPSEGDTVLTAVSIDDQPLTDAIKILARMANINYLIDPKVAFGTPGPDGKILPQPNVSIRWEKVTPQQALEALLNNYSLQLVEDPRTHIYRITMRDPAAPDPLFTKVIQLRYAGPSNVLASVQSVLVDKRSKVVADPRTSQLVVVATEAELNGVDEMLAHLDTPTKQVLIEAKILETTVNPKTVKGIDWSGTLSEQQITFGNGITTGTTTTTRPGAATTTTLPGGRTITTASRSSSQTLLETVLGGGGVSYNTRQGFSPSTAFLNADGLNVMLSFLNSSDDTKVISEPRMVTLDNQKATIDVGLMYPIVNVQASTVQTTGGSQISYSNLTVNLDVTPRITADNFVEMKVQQSVLRLGPQFTSTVADQDNKVDSFFTRKLETAVLIPSGNTLVMGGLISDELMNSNKKVPVLGDIPVLGYAFRKDSKSRNRANLIIFITPTIVQDGDFQPAKSTFLQSTGQEVVTEEWSAWDSGKPKDWSDPDRVSRHQAVFNEDLVRPASGNLSPQ